MRINKKGFTLIEILAAITIMGILTGIAVVSVTKIIEQGKKNHYTTAEENMTLAGQTFVQQNRSNLPKAIGQKKKIPMKMLVEKNYIQPIKDYSDNDCDMEKSYVQVFKYSQNDYSYIAYLECPNYNSKENLNDITPNIEAKINEDEDARTAHANIKITGNDKIVSYSYVLYRNNKEVKNTGNVQEKSLPATKSINFSLEDYTPGNIKIVVTATNIYGNTKTVTATKNIPDRKKPKCIIKEEDLPTSPKPWIKEGTRKISVGCDDGETGSGCTRTEYYEVFKTSMRTGTITIEDESGNKEECEVSVYIDKVNPTITVKAYKLNSSGNKTGNALKSISTTTSSNSKTLDLSTLNETEWLNKKDYPYGIYYEFTLNDNLELDSYNLKGNAIGLTKTNSTVNTISRAISNSNISGTSKTKNTSITTDGYNKTKIEIKDAAGNSATVTMTTPLDRVAPTVPTINMYQWKNNSTTPTNAAGLTSYTNDTWSNKNIYTTASNSTDGMSGFKEYQYTTTGETENNTNKAAQTRNIKAEGISYIKYRACDIAGNCSEYTDNKTIKIDKTSPTCEVSGGSTQWISATSTEQKRTITARCVDNGSTCDSTTAVLSKDYSEDMNITNAGAAGIGQGGIVYDNAGNSIECEANQTVKIDKQAPTCTSSGGSANWTNKTVTLTGTCSDTNGSGCKENITLDFKTNIDTTTASPGTVYDKAGNSASCPGNQTVKIDKTAPTCTSSGGNSNWTNQNVTLTGTCSDTGGSGCNNITYTYDKNTETTKASPGTVYDGAGNSASCPGNQTVKIDKTAPTCTSSGGNANWTNKSVTLTGTCNDSGGSGCSNVTLKYENNIETTTASPGTVYDGAGNSASCPANQTVKIDKTAPTCTSSGGSSDWTNQNITLTGTCADTGGSGCKENATKTFDSNKNLSSQTPGTVYDYAGNSASCPANQTVKIDKTAPTCSTTTNYSSWTNQNVTLTGTCSDTGGSGCKGNVTQTYSSEMNESKSPGTVYDYAGNSKTCPTKTVRIDKTPPTATPSIDGVYVETYGSDGVTNTGQGKVLGGSCSGLSCTVTVCVPNVKGSFQVFGFERNPSDSLSGYWTYSYPGRTMYDKNWVETGGGCLKTKGHNPCNWYGEYTIYDRADNSAKITYNIIVGYIGLNDGSGC